MKAMKRNDSPNLRKPLNRKTKSLKFNSRKENVANLVSGQDSSIENSDFLDQSELMQAVKKASATDSDRVKKLKRAIEKGEYKADTKRTAEKLLRLEDEIWSNNDEF